MRARMASKRGAAAASVLVALWGAVVSAPVAAEVPPGEDAASEYVKKLGCDQVKALAQAGAQEVFQVWADRIVVGASRDRVYGILERGVTDEAVDSLGELLNFLQVAEAVAAGDETAALQAVSGWTFDYYVVASTGPVGVAVWGTLKTLSEIAANLNTEMLWANIGTFADLVERDPRLAGPGGGDAFLDSYLLWDSDRVFGLLNNTTKMRGALAEFARVELQQNDFPYFPQWRLPENRNRVRVAANRLISDAARVAEVRRHQRLLRSQVDGLRAEVETLQAFSAWWSIIKGATCESQLVSHVLDPTGQCLESMITVTEMLAELQTQLAVPSAQTDGLADAESRLDTLELEADRLAALLERDLVEIGDLCGDAEVARAAVAASVTDLLSLEGHLRRDAAEVRRLAEAACSAVSAQEATARSQEASEAVDRMRITARHVSTIRQSLTVWTPPSEVDLASLERRLADLQPETTLISERHRLGEEDRTRSADVDGRAEVLLRACDTVERDQLAADDTSLRPRLAALRARVAAALESANGTPGGPMVADDLEVRIRSLTELVRQQAERQREGRACLSVLPDPVRLEREQTAAEVAVDELLASAEGAAARASACREGPMAPDRTTTTTVPDLVGRSDSLAATWLDELGLVASLQLEGGTAPGAVEGQVARQSPVGGTVVDSGSLVTLWVYGEGAAEEPDTPPSPEETRPAITQADCDRSWPGMILVESGDLGECRCPAGTAWSTVRATCLSLSVLGGFAPDRDGGCAHMPGTLRDSVTGECRCPLGRWDQDRRRCVDPGVADRERRIAEGRQGAECERLYSEIQVLQANREPVYRQMAANSERQARQMGCDPGRIEQAIRDGGGWAPPPADGGGGGGGSGGSPGGSGGGGGGGANAGTCKIIEYNQRSEVNIVVEQQGDGNHLNVFILSVEEDTAAEQRAYWGSQPRFRVEGTYRSYSEAMEAARRLCRGRSMW